jgi:hypothetical protein
MQGWNSYNKIKQEGGFFKNRLPVIKIKTMSNPLVPGFQSPLF